MAIYSSAEVVCPQDMAVLYQKARHDRMIMRIAS
jgi:hypothetical protein